MKNIYIATIMDNNTDSILINNYKATNHIKFASELYASYIDLVYGVCLKYLANREKAQDAVMDIFEKLLVELKKHETPNEFKTWLYVVTKNFCLMQLRKDGTENKAFKKMSAEFVENGFSKHPLDEDEEADYSEALQKCMEELKEYQRKCIDLFYYKKLCYKEIANELNLSEKKVKSDIQNGKRNLKICIEKLNSQAI